MSTIELTNGSASLTARADYLLVVEHGTLTSGEEVLRYVSELELASQRFHLRRLLVDARSEARGDDQGGDARAAMWRWIRSQRAFEMIGFVLRDEMMIARVNMTALSERLPVRAFTAVAEGHRWLARQRSSSTALPSARSAPSSVPPPPMHATHTPPTAAATRRTPPPARTPTPTPPEPSPTGRQTARVAALSSQEAEAVLRTPREGSARTTVKIARIDEAMAEELRGKPTSR